MGSALEADSFSVETIQAFCVAHGDSDFSDGATGGIPPRPCTSARASVVCWWSSFAVLQSLFFRLLVFFSPLWSGGCWALCSGTHRPAPVGERARVEWHALVFEDLPLGGLHIYVGLTCPSTSQLPSRIHLCPSFPRRSARHVVPPDDGARIIGDALVGTISRSRKEAFIQRWRCCHRRWPCRQLHV